MKPNLIKTLALLPAMTACLQAAAKIDGSPDPDAVVAEWSEQPGTPVIDINFSDEMWPGQTWQGTTAIDCPEITDANNGGYVNTVVDVPVNGGTEITYPVLFHNCTFANKTSFNGYAGTTAAFARVYYEGQSPLGTDDKANDWTVAGHTTYLEDNIKYGDNGKPVYGEAGFVQMCRNQGYVEDGVRTSLHGWVVVVYGVVPRHKMRHQDRRRRLAAARMDGLRP